MSRAHAGMGVNHATKDETSHFPAGTDLAIVHETRIRKLWTDARNIVYKDLSTIFAKMNNWAPHPFTSPDKIDKFMKDPENAETLTKVLNIFSTIKKAFYSPETRKLLVDYKKTLTGHSKGTQSAHPDRSILMTVTKRELEQNGWDLSDPLVKLVLETSVR
ncbi:MAG: hypothetical protein M3M85_02460 [bacterium]|nr:hypothetical protein [bacterium]